MNKVYKRVYPHMAYAHCDECDVPLEHQEPNYTYQMEALLYWKQQHRHICPNCEKVYMLDRIYPSLEYRENQE